MLEARTLEATARELGGLLRPDQVLASPAASRAYDCDAYTVDRSRPTVIVLPETTEEVANVVRWCVANDTPFTARGAGTGLSGGALPALGGVVISTKRMTQILEIDLPNRCLLAQSGTVNRKLTDAVAHAGLHFAPDPSSQSVSTLGGNIAENAGGPHTLKYGVTVQHILGVTMVDPTGEVLTFGGKVAGCPGIDFLPVIVGSEGTMGIVTEAWVKLTPTPKSVGTLLASFASVAEATHVVAEIVASGTIPAALEMMDLEILKAVKAAFGFDYPEGTQAMLLVECDGESDSQVADEVHVVQGVCAKHGCLEVQVAQNDLERARLWMVRKKAVGAMGRLAPSIVTHDGVIPRSKLPEMLEVVYRVASEAGIGVANMFHAGDGNLHPCFYFDDRDPKQVEAVVHAGETLMRLCVELGGSITGEHGVGVEKLDLMPLMFTPADLAVQGLVKQTFNTGALCNPCKVLPSQRHCTEHRMRWRGVAT
ncbi:MAG: FAD-binding oxidoreductase [Fimbriimonas sp.]